MHYNSGDFLITIRRIVKHFQLTRFSLLGHSWGAGVASIFAATHPELVSVRLSNKKKYIR